MPDRAKHLAAGGDHRLARIAFQRLAESIIGGQEEPGVPPRLTTAFAVALDEA